MIEYIIPIIIILVLLILNGLFVAAEFAIIAAPRAKISQMADTGSASAIQVLNILNNPSLQNRFITTAQVGITFASLGLGMYGEHTMAEWLLELFHDSLNEATAHTVASVLAVGLLTYFHVVLGEMIPKSLALQAADKTALVLNRPMHVIEKLFFPIVVFLNNIGLALTKIIPISDTASGSRLFTSDEIEYIVEESFEGGLLEPSDQLFIENILDLEERTVVQAMTPRNRICGVPVTASRAETIKIISETTKTRYPVYNNNLDHVIGILHIKDLARHIIHTYDETNFNLNNLARPAIYVPETMHLDELLVQFRNGNHQVAMVFGEFGGTTGIITLEDLVEEVVGEIQDEFDQETLPIKEISSQLLEVRGNVILEELEQLYDFDLSGVDAKTIGGLVMEKLGRIPKSGDFVNYGNLSIEVIKTEGLAVGTLLIHMLSDE